jgi:hypothetical protein
MDYNEAAEVWEEYKQDWSSGESPEMNFDTFCDLFHFGGISEEAIELVRSSQYAHETLDEAIDVSFKILNRVFKSENRFRVWFALKDEDSIDEIILNWPRTLIDAVYERASFISAIVSNCVNYYGRRWIRNRIFRWWREADFLEEEKEAFLYKLADKDVLNWSLIGQLGSDAVETVQRLIRWGSIRAESIDGFDFEALRSIRGSQPPDWLSARIGSLLQPVTLPVDIRDSRLQLDELNKAFGNVEASGIRSKKFIRRAIEELRHHFGLKEAEWFIEALTQYGTSLLHYSTASGGLPSIRFPLLRFLHLRLLLEAPSLTSALSTPELFLVPDVVMYTLGRDAVTYSPELRVFRDTDRRWRARWVEASGEALSVMFLESAVDLDLSTLNRITEQSSEPTPDFKAQTNNGERIVFEAKGSTSWETHKKQRKDALNQLGKRMKSSSQKRENIFSGISSGRAFASSFFAALQGDDWSSLLYVEDPVFRFDNFFLKGWQEEARINHYAAVLEAAQLFEVADNLRHRLITKERPEESHIFTIEGEKQKRKESSRFVGNYLNVQDVARRFRHPELRAIDKLRIFVGVDEWFFKELSRNRLPGGIRSKDAQEEEPERELPPRIPGWGLLSGYDPDGPPRGVYSSLADGAFLAFEIR